MLIKEGYRNLQRGERLLQGITCGNTGIVLDTQSTEGYTGLLLDTQGYKWLQRVTCGYTVLRMDTQDYLWIHRVTG